LKPTSVIGRDTQLKVLAHMSYTDARSANAIAALMGKSARVLWHHLPRMAALGLVKYRIVAEKNSQKHTIQTQLWTIKPEGEVEPLNPPESACDARALADCFGGYTYLASTFKGQETWPA